MALHTERDRLVDVTVLLFAAHRELAGGKANTVVTLPERSTVDGLLAELRARGGGWASLPRRAAVAVNRSYANGDTVLSEGDEVALIPPVAGG
ncbi:MAG: MoaD/ThiS family protein [Acidobacteria bacterium]|nr:MoaD/ThiS family protein [Gemmatimonadota bacterium]MYA10118.1 MoaD/ThiS family protein [Gemmatimonadota bacterium]MYD12220.1 MoaD/ThiS family protein [Gemmatimonadota bacterium]MYF15626.1 MoaD/ThiS family protein [Acidobacteriota bacterium]